MAQVSEKERLEGFAEHYRNQDRFDEARRKGERAYFEEEAQWDAQKQRQLAEHKKHQKEGEMPEDGPEAKADLKTKKVYADEYEKSRQEYVKNKNHYSVVNREKLHLPTESQELGLNLERPRYEYRKRASYGGQPKFGKMTGGAFGGGARGGSTSSGGSSFPPPPTFDDFGGGGGYVPAPNFPEDFGDVPPPIPPPSGFGDDFGGGGGMDFPPPPPPPPSPFGDEGGF